MGRILSLVLLAVIVLGLAACPPAGESQPEIVYHVVVYQVTGTAVSATVRFLALYDAEKEILDTSIPWSIRCSLYAGDLAYLSATSNHEDSTISVTITYDEDILLDTATNAGDFVTATAYGYLPEE